MTWQGDTEVPQYFGLRGFKSLCRVVMDEINELRAAAGLPARTWQQFKSKMDQKMSEFAGDDAGPEPGG